MEKLSESHFLMIKQQSFLQRQGSLVLDRVRSLPKADSFDLKTLSQPLTLFFTNKKEPFYCSVCCSYQPPEDQCSFPECQHSFCKGCTATQLTIMVAQDRVPIKCWFLPEDGKEMCNKLLNLDWITASKLVEEKVIVQHKERQSLTNPNAARCPKCSVVCIQTLMTDTDTPRPEMTCPSFACFMPLNTLAKSSVRNTFDSKCLLILRFA